MAQREEIPTGARTEQHCIFDRQHQMLFSSTDERHAAFVVQTIRAAGYECLTGMRLSLLPGYQDSAGTYARAYIDMPEGMEQVKLAMHRWYDRQRELMALPSFDLVRHLYRQIEFSAETFGPGARAQGVVDHIRKELCEIEADPADLDEWVDLVILALDGAWRAGYPPEQIAGGIQQKQKRNEGRKWPDWRTADTTKAIEHDRSGE